MDVAQVFHMNGGIGETSYANNSLVQPLINVQRKMIALTKFIREEAVDCLFKSKLPRSLAIADLGCSSGPNTFIVISELIKAVEKLCRELSLQSPESHIFLNDLPNNDLNIIFNSIGGFKDKLSNEMVSVVGASYFTGVLDSLCGKLFPPKLLHFVHSSYCINWLSQAPEGVVNNKGNICVASMSPSNVVKAYYEQFQRDFSRFLQCREEEVVEGGRMVLTFLGRRSHDPSSKEGCCIFKLLAEALNDMVLEGIIEEEQMDSFNIPFYSPCPSEVKTQVLREGSFGMNGVHVSQVNWKEACDSAVESDGGYEVAKCVRAVAEPLLVDHLGEAIIEDVFKRYQHILTDCMLRRRQSSSISRYLSPKLQHQQQCIS